MYDAGKVVPGLVVFVAIATLPVWLSLATGAKATEPEIAKPTSATECVLDTATMRRDHMKLLLSWRDDVVRSNQREFVTADGRRFEKSLTGTCLRCHTDQKQSCDRCHNYLDVHPNCWDCHVETGGGR
jgi:[DsrC]-trisulfide reductase subunit J